MAEIEHFCDPRDKSHKKFKSVENTEMTFYSACNQMDGELPKKMTIGEAVRSVSCQMLPFEYPVAHVLNWICLVAGFGEQRDSWIFLGQGFPLPHKDRSEQGQVEVPPAHVERDGSLRYRLLGCRVQDFLCKIYTRLTIRY